MLPRIVHRRTEIRFFFCRFWFSELPLVRLMHLLLLFGLVEVLTDTLKNREYTKKKWKARKELQEENKRLKDFFKKSTF